MSSIEEMTDDELNQKLKDARRLQLLVGSIWGVIITVWVVLGYWQSNVPVFISTIALGLTSAAITNIAPQKIAAEIKRRTET
ncbi:MAG: hypothetical protein KDA91_03295 [Planctomycetaceae bacterium]|nr:hypothetical protein [Planctomycetaceae bacterium]